ncbi:MAG: antibiotic biosynthesis monooxygenase [Anaerolineae bacterium]|nr:antibiotic biosynthesis monooxygenase [Gemmatimonadaceae bacterium]
MIVRIWRGQAEARNSDAYQRHVTTNVFPTLPAIPGHRAAYLLRREMGGQVEFLAVTLWESMEAVKQFAGTDPDVAVVEPAARAVLSDFDTFVKHYELVHRSSSEELNRQGEENAHQA